MAGPSSALDAKDGWRARGGSMLPSMFPGARVDTAPFSWETVRPGDIVCFLGEQGTPVAHRVFAKRTVDSKRSLVVRGDAQPRSEIVPVETVFATVSAVDHLGFKYRTEGPLGRLWRKIALEDRLRWRVARRTSAILGGALLRAARPALRLRRALSVRPIIDED